MLLVSYRLSDSDSAWRAGMMRDQAVVDVSAYVSSDGRSYPSVQELLPLLDELCVWASQQFDMGNRVLSIEE